MFEFFDRIIGFFQTVFEWFINLVKSLILWMETLSSMSAMTIALPTYLPSILAMGFVIVVTIGILKVVIGR